MQDQRRLIRQVLRATWRPLLGLAAVLAVLLPVPAHGQRVSTGPWSTIPLPPVLAGAVNALWVDQEQRVLWVGTKNGLGRYDGREWQSFTLEPCTLVPVTPEPATPESVTPEPATPEPATPEPATPESVTPEPATPESVTPEPATPEPRQPAQVRALAGDGDGGVWVGTDCGLGHFDGSRWRRFTAAEDGLPDDWINALLPDGMGGLWVGTLRGFAYLAHHAGHYTVDPESKFTALDSEPLGAVRAIIPAQGGGQFFAVDYEVVHLSPTAAIRRYGTPNDLDRGIVQALASAGQNALWVGTESGLYRLSGEAFERIPLTDGMTETKHDILSMAEDGAGGLWFGTPGGLYHFNGEQIDEHRQATGGELVADRVLAIERAGDGTLWLGTSGGLNRWNPEAWRNFAIGSEFHPLAAQGGRMWAISDQALVVWERGNWAPVSDTSGPWPDGDATWFGNIFKSVGDGLYRQQVMRLVAPVYHVPGDSCDQLNTLDGSACGDLWIGTDKGVLHFLGGELKGRYNTGDELPGEHVYALLAEKEAVWAGTDQGLAWWDGQTWRQANWSRYDKADTVHTIARGADQCHSLWVGTAGGLWRLPQHQDPSDPGKWQRYTKEDRKEDGLTSSEVDALWADANGQLWVGTVGGLYGLDDNDTCDYKTDDAWVTLKAEDGLPNNQVTALWRDAQGALWILTGTKARTALVRHSPTTLMPSLNVTQKSKINWWSLDVTLEFQGTSLTADRLTYRYQLPGQAWKREDPAVISWNPADGDRFTAQVFDPDLNSAALKDARLEVPGWKRLWGYWWVRLVVYSIASLGALAAIGQAPLGRWWRGLHRAGYRETWEIAFSQARPDLPVCTVHARRYFKRDVRLLFEGRARQLVSPVGEPIVTSIALPENLTELHKAWRSAADPNALEPLHALAHPLAAALLPEAVVRQLQAAAGRGGYRVRLRLNFAQAPALALYPWEVSQPPGLETLGLNPATALSRWLPPADGADVGALAVEPDDRPPVLAPLRRDQTLKVLLVVASPHMPPAYEDLPRLEAADELKRIEEALDSRQAVLDDLAGVSAGGEETGLDLKEALAARLMSEQQAPDIVHFVGHAGPHPRKPDEIALYFEDKRGVFSPLNAEQLIDMILGGQRLLRRPKLLVLNACQTGTVHGGETLAGLVPALITRTGLMAVVGMQYPIRDEAAAVFTSTFYRELLQTQPVDYAISRARQAMRDQVGGRDWAAPVLYMRMADGMIYEP